MNQVEDIASETPGSKAAQSMDSTKDGDRALAIIGNERVNLTEEDV